MNRELRAALQTIRGIGYRKSVFICAKVGIIYPFFIQDLNSYFFSILTFLFKMMVKSVDKVRRYRNRMAKTLLSLNS